MKTLHLVLSLVVIGLLFCGCKTQKHTPSASVEIHTEVREIIRDTLIYVPADKETVTALLECDSTGNILLKEIVTLQGQLNAKAKIEIREKILTVDCVCDSLAIYHQVKDRYEEKKSIQTNTIFVEKELKGWQKTLMWIGAISLITYLIVLIIKMKGK